MTPRAFLRIVMAVQALVFTTATVAQERLVEQPKTAGVHDGAGMFSEAAIREADASLRNLALGTGVVAVVETVGSLKGEAINEVAIQRARRSEIKGIFVFVAKEEKKIEVLASSQFRDAFSPEALHGVRKAFSEDFLKGDFDGGLRRGVKAIASVVATARIERKLPSSEATAEAAPTRSLLIARNQVRLTLEGARVIIDAAERKAAAMNLKSNIAVVDDGGHLLSFDRMSGARPASAYTAITKAVSAATFRQPTGPIPPGTASPDPILNLGIENAAAASGGKITALKGGVPVVVDGQVIGGVGAGGGSGEQDSEVVRAGIDAFLKLLESPKAAVDPVKD